MHTLIAIGAVQALFLAALALRKKPRTPADPFLALLLGLWAGSFAVVYLVLARGWQDLLILLVNAGLLVAPIYFLYARTLMGGPRLRCGPRRFARELPGRRQAERDDERNSRWTNGGWTNGDWTNGGWTNERSEPGRGVFSVWTWRGAWPCSA